MAIESGSIPLINPAFKPTPVGTVDKVNTSIKVYAMKNVSTSTSKLAVEPKFKPWTACNCLRVLNFGNERLVARGSLQ